MAVLLLPLPPGGAPSQLFSHSNGSSTEVSLGPRPGTGPSIRGLTLVTRQLLPKAAQCGEVGASVASALAKGTASPAPLGEGV